MAFDEIIQQWYEANVGARLIAPEARSVATGFRLTETQTAPVVSLLASGAINRAPTVPR
ncbi:MAG TPA: hypothetical protein VFQ30_02580 [Ktedonobacteraceae bacterium]|nr:hypothetical protein [Ktedonobacteraceae bacterium]